MRWQTPSMCLSVKYKRIRKRYEETGDVFWHAQVRQTPQENRSGGPFVGSKIQDQPVFHCSRAPRDLVTWSPRVNQNSLSNSVSKWPPWLNQCPETSTEQKTIKKPCGFCQRPTACQKDGRWKSCRRWISQMNLLLNYITVTANIAGDLLEPAWIRDSPRKQPSLVAEKSWSGVTSSMGCVREICRVEGNINSLKYQEVLSASYIPNHKRGQILQQDGAPSQTSISTSKFLKAKKIKVLQDWPAQSPDMNIIEHVWGRMKEEAWKMKSNNLDELWEACKTAFFAIPDDFINKYTNIQSLPNRMDAVPSSSWKSYKILNLDLTAPLLNSLMLCNIFWNLKLNYFLLATTFVLPKSDLSVFIKW